jgi:hypothetical protein
MVDLGVDLGYKCVFMKPPKFISHFSHYAQFKYTLAKVFNVCLNTQPMTWIQKNSTSNLHSCKHTPTLNAHLLIARTSSICHHTLTSTLYRKHYNLQRIACHWVVTSAMETITTFTNQNKKLAISMDQFCKKNLVVALLKNLVFYLALHHLNLQTSFNVVPSSTICSFALIRSI